MIYGIISDIHSDINALEKVMNSIKIKDVDQIFCCGDMIGYGNNPEEVIELLRLNNVSCVTGNHEQALFDDLEFAAINSVAQKAIEKHYSLLSDNSMEYLEELPSSFTHKNMRIVHGVPPYSFTEYIHYQSYDAIINAFDGYKEQLAFCGHTHLTSIIKYDRCNIAYDKKIIYGKAYKLCNELRYIINVGSVSLPRGQNKEKAQFVIYDNKKQEVQFYEV